MQLGFYQSRSMTPKVSGKDGGQFNRLLFREQHQESVMYNTVQVFTDDRQLRSLVEQAAEILGLEVYDPSDEEEEAA